MATTYQAYYDLQLQLVSGAMTRDYAVLCHGWSCPARIEANVHWLEDGPAWLFWKPSLVVRQACGDSTGNCGMLSYTSYRFGFL